MNCPHCHSSSTRERVGRAVQGFRRYQCRDCGRRYNERTGTALNRVQVSRGTFSPVFRGGAATAVDPAAGSAGTGERAVDPDMPLPDSRASAAIGGGFATAKGVPTDIVFLVVFWRLRDKLSLRDLAEMFLVRGLVFTHEAVRNWEAKLAPLLADALRRRRVGKAGRCWHVDETDLKVAGAGCYLYWAIDRDGTVVDVSLSNTRDLAAARAFFRSAKSVTQVGPEPVTTDGHSSSPKAIAEELGTDVDHRVRHYKNNVLEQDHRPLKARHRPMRGFKAFASAHRFGRAFDEVRDVLRPASHVNQTVSLACRRAIHVRRVAALRDLISAA